MSNAEKMLLTISKGTGPSCTVEYLSKEVYMKFL